MAVWQPLALFSPISLFGFWTDVVLFLLWLAWMLWLVVRSRAATWLRCTAGATSGVLCVFLLTVLSTMGGMFFLFDLLGTRTVPLGTKREGLYLTHLYFTPVGAYGCGQGELTTSKALILFPFLEYRTDYDPCTLENWGCLIEKGSLEDCY